MKTLESLFSEWRLGTTSYVFTDGNTVRESYETNIMFLGPHVRIIQLLLFGKDFLFEWEDDAWVERVDDLKKQYDLVYVIHLPLDFHLWPAVDEADLQRLWWIVERTKPLQPIGYILHLDRNDGLYTQSYIPVTEEKREFRRLLERLEDMKDVPFLFENTSYDLSFFHNEIRHSPFGVCFDVGHWWLLGKEVEEFVIKLGDRVKLLHVHGVRGGRDHMPLSVLGEKHLQEVCWLMERYPAVLEVFSLEDLLFSLMALKVCGKGGERDYSSN